jgi:hypothetical protein
MVLRATKKGSCLRCYEIVAARGANPRLATFLGSSVMSVDGPKYSSWDMV